MLLMVITDCHLRSDCFIARPDPANNLLWFTKPHPCYHPEPSELDVCTENMWVLWNALKNFLLTYQETLVFVIRSFGCGCPGFDAFFRAGLGAG
jgi:hypothetical protein